MPASGAMKLRAMVGFMGVTNRCIVLCRQLVSLSDSAKIFSPLPFAGVFDLDVAGDFCLLDAVKHVDKVVAKTLATHRVAAQGLQCPGQADGQFFCCFTMGRAGSAWCAQLLAQTVQPGVDL